MPAGTDDLATAVVLGAALGVGFCLLLARAPRWGAPSLARRIAPYIRDITDPQGTGVLTPSVSQGIPPGWASIRHRLIQLAGTDTSLTRRLDQAARRPDAAAFRGRQLAFAIAGLGLGGVILVVAVLLGAPSPAIVLLPPVLAVAGAVICDLWLSHLVRVRISRIQEELPTILEFLALCLSAGEGILDSLRRVSEVGSGELTSEVRGVVVAVGTGSPLPEALAKLADRLGISALTRSVDQVVAALERGAPLAQVLHAQALDAREDAKRTLIERAGRKEIYMLFPLVFLILPLSILFAVFPGVFMLRLGVG